MISVPDDKAGGEAELKVLALNSGSSSLKFGLYRVGPLRTDMLISGEAEDIGDATSGFHIKGLAKQLLALSGNIDSRSTGRCR